MVSKIDHFGISVSNLDNSINFYKNILGMNLKRKLTVIGEGIAKVNEFKGEGRVEIAILELNNQFIELLEFKTPKGEQTQSELKANQYGRTHLAFEVKDIKTVCSSLKKHGIVFTSTPMKMIPENFDIQCPVCTFFKDPDGVSIEILER